MCDQRHVLNDQISNDVVSTAWPLTVGGVSNSRSLAEPSCLGTRIDSETGTEIGGPEDSVFASMETAVLYA
jgi:hypothetical protein